MLSYILKIATCPFFPLTSILRSNGSRSSWPLPPGRYFIASVLLTFSLLLFALGNCELPYFVMRAKTRTDKKRGAGWFLDGWNPWSCLRPLKFACCWSTPPGSVDRVIHPAVRFAIAASWSIEVHGHCKRAAGRTHGRALLAGLPFLALVQHAETWGFSASGCTSRFSPSDGPR